MVEYWNYSDVSFSNLRVPFSYRFDGNHARATLKVRAYVTHEYLNRFTHDWMDSEFTTEAVSTPILFESSEGWKVEELMLDGGGTIYRNGLNQVLFTVRVQIKDLKGNTINPAPLVDDVREALSWKSPLGATLPAYWTASETSGKFVLGSSPTRAVSSMGVQTSDDGTITFPFYMSCGPDATVTKFDMAVEIHTSTNGTITSKSISFNSRSIHIYTSKEMNFDGGPTGGKTTITAIST